VKRNLALLVQVAGLAATGWVVWTAAVVPRLARQPLAGVIWDALQHALFACFASAAITLGLYLLIARSRRTDALLAALRTSATAVWFAPATLLLSELSPLALGAALVLVISTTRLLYFEWRVIHPDQPADEFVIARELFEPPPSPLQLKDLAPALVASFGLEAGIVAVLMGVPLLAAVLFSLTTAMLTFASLSSGAYEPQTNRSLPRSILGLALTVILAAGLTVGGLAGHIQRGARWNWGAGNGSVPTKRSRLVPRRWNSSSSSAKCADTSRSSSWSARRRRKRFVNLANIRLKCRMAQDSSLNSFSTKPDSWRQRWVSSSSAFIPVLVMA
jgi:hypothetical protein